MAARRILSLPVDGRRKPGPKPKQSKRPKLTLEWLRVSSPDEAKGFECGNLCLLANLDIEPGTQLIAERPLYVATLSELKVTDIVRLEKSVCESFMLMSKDDRDLVKGLTCNFCMYEFEGEPYSTWIDTPWSGVFRSNAIPFHPDARSDKSDMCGIFPYWLSKMNHSCDPNAQQSWNSETGAVSLYSIRKIKKDEEVTISYIPNNRLDPVYLYQHFGICCSCDYCALPHRSEYKIARDIDRYHIEIIGAALGKLAAIDATKVNYGKICVLGRVLWSLFDMEDSRDWRRARMMYDMFFLNLKQGNSTGAGYFAALATVAYRDCEGYECPKFGDIRRALLAEIGEVDHLKKEVWVSHMEKTAIGLHKHMEKCSDLDRAIDDLFSVDDWPEKDPRKLRNVAVAYALKVNAGDMSEEDLGGPLISAAPGGTTRGRGAQMLGGSRRTHSRCSQRPRGD